MEEKNSYLSADPETIRQIDEKMPPEEELQDLAEFFKVFGDATRLKILSVLLCSEMCVYDIATLLGMSQSAISHFPFPISAPSGSTQHDSNHPILYHRWADDPPEFPYFSAAAV